MTTTTTAREEPSPTPSASPRHQADTTSMRNSRKGTTNPATLSLPRLHLLRLGYLVMGVGLAVTKWPLVINHTGPWPAMEGAVTAMLVALSLLSFLGLRYPVQMLPILLFESAWKLIWMVVVALPLWTADQLDPANLELFSRNLWVVIVLAVTPWRYVVAQYVRKQGDRWRSDANRPANDRP
ncbi:MAG TPA: hypothetical protein VKB85_12035 [Propionibacteriaceae bacterium]|nr:hypothetical protein [Propionibacteriaceae bacterium]